MEASTTTDQLQALKKVILYTILHDVGDSIYTSRFWNHLRPWCTNNPQGCC